MLGLGRDQKDFYHEKGYLVIENCIPQNIIDRIRDSIHRLRDKAKDIKTSNSDFDVAAGHSTRTPKLRRIKDPVKQDPIFDELMRSEILVEKIKPLLGGSVRFDHSKLNFKPPSSNAKIEWHQDWAFYPHTNDDILAIGVMIEDCTLENGPLMVIPGSHKGPVFDHHLDGIFAGGINPTSLGDEFESVTLTAPAGSISIHHVRTLHASTENYSSKDRPLLLYSYSAVDAFPIIRSIDFEEYNSRILVGEPTIEPRSKNVPMRVPLPKLVGADSIYDDQSKLNGV